MVCVPNATDIWQPADGGYASTLNTLINQDFFNWLDDEDNVEKWYGAESHITASEKRILITKWAGNAYHQLNRPSYDKFRWRLFERRAVWLQQMAVKMTKSIQKVFQTTKCPHLTCLIPQELHQHLLLYHKRTVMAQKMRMFLMILKVKMK